MRAVSLKRRRVNRGPRREAVTALYEAAPWCARCCRTDVELAGHERRGRAQGGNPANPDCILCGECNTWCEDNPVDAAWSGWKISRKHPRFPGIAANEAWDLNGDIVVFGVAP